MASDRSFRLQPDVKAAAARQLATGVHGEIDDRSFREYTTVDRMCSRALCRITGRRLLAAGVVNRT